MFKFCCHLHFSLPKNVAYVGTNNVAYVGMNNVAASVPPACFAHASLPVCYVAISSLTIWKNICASVIAAIRLTVNLKMYEMLLESLLYECLQEQGQFWDAFSPVCNARARTPWCRMNVSANRKMQAREIAKLLLNLGQNGWNITKTFIFFCEVQYTRYSCLFIHVYGITMGFGPLEELQIGEVVCLLLSPRAT